MAVVVLRQSTRASAGQCSKRALRLLLALLVGAELLWGSASPAPGFLQKSASNSPALARRTAALSAAALLGSSGLRPAQAAIPTPEEFYIDNGSKIRDSKEELEAKIKAYEDMVQSAETATLDAAAKQALADLDEVVTLIKGQDIEGARMILAKPNNRYMGLVISGTKFRSTPQGPWERQCMKNPGCESELQDARASLNQLEEWCFTNQVPIFNSIDRRQVMARPETAEAMEKQKQLLQEPLDYVEEARVPLRKIASGKF